MSLRPKRYRTEVLEHRPIRLPPELDTPAVRERLLGAAEAAGMPGAIEVRRRRLYAGNCVGVVDIGNVAIEILPKTREGCTLEEGRSFLTDLLRFSGRERQRLATGSAAIAESSDGLLEVILAWAARTASDHLSHGLPRRYVQVTEPSPALRGRVSMAHAARLWPGSRLEFVVTHAPLSQDNAVGRSVRWLLLRVAELTRRADTRAIALSTADELGGVAEVDLDEATLDAATLRPMEEHWEPLLRLAGTLLRQRRLDPTRVGSHQAVAVLFTLHDLFEDVLRRVLSQNGPAHGLAAASIPRHLLSSPDGPRVRLRPDFVLSLEGVDGPGVADAKWKDIWTDGGNLAVAPRPSDAHQVVAYMTAGRARSGFLIAPLPDRFQDDTLRVFPHAIAGSGAHLTVIGVHLPTLVSRNGGSALAGRLCGAVADRIKAATAAATPAYSAAI